MFPALRLLAAGAGLLAAAGCATERAPYNDAIAHVDRDFGYRFERVWERDQAGTLMVILYFSGGGTRAAALSYGVLEELRRTTVAADGTSRPLLDHVALISAVSGGSYTAAYYGLFGERIFTDFERRFLKRDVQQEIRDSLFSLSNLARVTSPYFGRVDVATEYLDREIFEERRFADLLSAGQRGRLPFITINATDMTIGARFEFTQDSFDRICSNLQTLPVARAVAASSAVPVVVSPVTLVNYAGRCGYREPDWVAQALRDRSSGVRRFYMATDLRSYTSGKRPYVHLLDGGMSDNLGLRTLLDRIHMFRSPVLAAQNTGAGGAIARASRILHIVVNAQTRGDVEGLDQRAEIPTLGQVAYAVGLTTDRYSVESIALTRNHLDEWTQEIRAHRRRRQAEAGGQGLPADFDQYFVEITFDAIADEAERDYFNRLPTALSLPVDAVDRLRAAAGRLMRESPDYTRLLRDLN